MFVSLGPHFFSRTFKEEAGRSGSDALNAALFETYHIELAATRLGINDLVFIVLRVFSDLEATGPLDAYNTEQGQRKKVGSATISMTGTRSQDSKDVYRSCKIEQLEVETGDMLTNMEALAAVLRYIQSFCVENHAKHLAMAPTQGSCWFSGLLKPAGFNLCDCERLENHLDDGIQLCMVLPTPPIGLSVPINVNKLAKEPATKAERRPDQNSGAVAEGSTFRKPSQPQHREIGTSPAASQAAMEANDSKAFEWQSLIDSMLNKATVSSNTPNNTPSAAKSAGLPGSLPKKTYCMFWVRNGECDYTQTGCKFKHEMPVDEETRQKLGLREIPRWFKESPEYFQFLQQVERSAAGRLNISGYSEKDIFTVPSSRPGSSRNDSGIGSHGGGKTGTTTRAPAKISSYTVQSPHGNHQQSIIASNTEANTARAGSPSATKINSTKATNAIADRRSDRGIYKPPRARASSGASDIRAASKEKPNVKGSIMEEPSKGHAESRGGSRIPASSTHSGPSKQGLPSSLSAADSAQPMGPGSTKRKSSSPAADVNNPGTGPGHKKKRGGGRNRPGGSNNGQARN